MDEILSALGLEHLTDTFAVNQVNPKEAVCLTDTQFQLLGVNKVGDRVRIKQKCKETIDKQSSALPVVQRLRTMFQSKRQEQTSGKTKSQTLRIQTGWKHKDKSSSKHKMITAAKGGGSLKLDVERDASMESLLELIHNLYFPGGINKANDLLLNDLTTKLATFSGEELPKIIYGKPFSMYAFFQYIKTHPVRVYLETTFKDEMLTSSDEEHDLQDILGQTRTTRNEGAKISVDGGTQSPIIQPSTPTVTFMAASTSSHNSPYSNYIDLIGDDDDTEDEETMHVSHTIHSTTDASAEVPQECLEKILQRHMSEQTGNKRTIIINRKRLLHTTLIATKDNFNFQNTPFIVFAGEDGEDGGGPRREFFKLLMQEVSQSMGVFHKVENGKLYFTYSIKSLRERKYTLAGQFVKWSITHGGPGLCALSPCVFNLMTESSTEVDLEEIHDVPDQDSRENLKKIMNSTRDNFQDVISQLTSWLIDQGVTNVHTCTFRYRDNLTRDLLTHQLYYRVQPAIVQFQEGLGKLWEDVKRNPHSVRPLFVWKASPPLSFCDMRKLYKVDYAPLGSNDRTLEEDSIYCFEVFLQKASSGGAAISLDSVLEFWTGANAIPPCGFPHDLEIEFYTREPDIMRLPSSSTCAQILRLPRGIDDPSELQNMMEYAVREAQGFGKI